MTVTILDLLGILIGNATGCVAPSTSRDVKDLPIDLVEDAVAIPSDA